MIEKLKPTHANVKVSCCDYPSPCHHMPSIHSIAYMCIMFESYTHADKEEQIA